MLVETFLAFVGAVVVVWLFLYVVFGLAVGIYGPTGVPRRRFRLRQLRQVRIWQLCILVLIVAFVLGGHGYYWFVNAALLLGIAMFLTLLHMAWAWLREAQFLMGRADADFPGRNDRMIWLALLVFLAPVGLWLFRCYRLAHWPEPTADPEGEVSASALVEVAGAVAAPVGLVFRAQTT